MIRFSHDACCFIAEVENGEGAGRKGRGVVKLLWKSEIADGKVR